MPLHRRILFSPPSDGPDSSSSSRQIHINVIIAAVSAVSASLFLALIYYSILRRRRRTSIPSITAAAAARDNPFWHVKTVGLDESAIDALGSYPHRASGAAAEVVCSVCIAEILDGETIRLLPGCGHVFHVQCVDTWLRCHVSCPLCRSAVGVAGPTGDDVEVAVAVAVAVADPQLEGDEGESEMGVRVRVSIEIPESSDWGLRSNSLDSVGMGGLEEEKEGGCSNSWKEEGSEKGRSESGRNLWFQRLGRTKSNSTVRL